MVAEHVKRMQERDSEMNDKLSAGAYAYKQIRNVVVNLIGAVGGGAIGWAIGGTMKHTPLEVPEEYVKTVASSKVFQSFVEKPKKWVGAGIGYMVGSTVALLYLGYEHWAQGEAQRLAVDEINRDMAESKLRMNPELVRENNLLREMVAKQDDAIKTRDHAAPAADDAAPAEKHESHKPHSKVSTHDAELDASPHARGHHEREFA